MCPEYRPPTIFMGCSLGNSQLCTDAEYVTYEDYQHGQRVLSTKSFKMEEYNSPINNQRIEPVAFGVFNGMRNVLCLDN